MSEPAAVTCLLNEACYSDIHSIYSRAVVDIKFSRPAENYTIVITLTVQVHVNHRIVIELFNRIVDMVQPNHLRMAELLIHSLFLHRNTEFILQLIPEQNRACHRRQQHCRMSLIRLWLYADIELAAA